MQVLIPAEEPSAPRRRRKNPPKVDGAIAGAWVCLQRDFRRVLGKNAWIVWTYLIRYRDRHGITFASAKTVTAHRGLSAKQVKLAMARLRMFGLMSEAQYFPLPRSQKKIRRRVVFGDYRNGMITVPQKLVRTLTSRYYHGGNRVGAGRPKINRRIIQISSFLAEKTGNQVGPSSNQAGPSSVFKWGQAPAQNASQDTEETAGNRRGEAAYKGSIIDPEVLRSSLREDLSTTASPAVIQSINSERENEVILMHPRRKPLQEEEPGSPTIRIHAHSIEIVDKHLDDLPVPTEDDLNEIASWAKEGSIVPRFPSAQMLNIPHLPSPPLFKPEMKDLDLAWALIKLYNGAIERIFKEPSFLFGSRRTTDLTRSKYYKLLVEGGRMLIELEFPPAAWIMFSFDAWRDINKSTSKKTPPPINFVFGERRIMDRRGWFSREMSGYCSRRLMASALAKDIVTRMYDVQRLRWAVLEKMERKYGYLPKEEARKALTELVEIFFPGGFDSWVERAQEKSAEDQAQIQQLVADGEFIWA